MGRRGGSMERNRKAIKLSFGADHGRGRSADGAKYSRTALGDLTKLADCKRSPPPGKRGANPCRRVPAATCTGRRKRQPLTANLQYHASNPYSYRQRIQLGV